MDNQKVNVYDVILSAAVFVLAAVSILTIISNM